MHFQSCVERPISITAHGEKNTVILIIRFSHGKMNTNHVMWFRYGRTKKDSEILFWDNKFSATLLDIKDKSGQTCPYIVTCQTTYSVAPFEFGAEFLIQIWRQEKTTMRVAYFLTYGLAQTTKVYLTFWRILQHFTCLSLFQARRSHRHRTWRIIKVASFLMIYSSFFGLAFLARSDPRFK